MNPILLVRLWLMVFLHYFVWSSWYVTMATYTTKQLAFSGGQVGLAYGTTAVGALLSPLIVGVIADRFFATQRILGFLHLLGAVLLYWVSTLKDFSSFYPVLLAYTVTYMAGHGLTNALTLNHSKNPAKEFPVVMVMASVGWIAAGLVVSALKLEDNAGMFRLAAGAALLMGLYSFTLPHTPPKGAGSPASLGSLLGFDAIKLLRNRSFARDQWRRVEPHPHHQQRLHSLVEPAVRVCQGHPSAIAAVPYSASFKRGPGRHLFRNFSGKQVMVEKTRSLLLPNNNRS